MPELGRMPSERTDSEPPSTAPLAAPTKPETSKLDKDKQGSVEKDAAPQRANDESFPALPKTRPSTASSSDVAVARKPSGKTKKASVSKVEKRVEEKPKAEAEAKTEPEKASQPETTEKREQQGGEIAQEERQEDSKAEAQTVEAEQKPVADEAASSAPPPGPAKRQHPGKLDISAAKNVKEAEKASESSKPSSPTASVRENSATPSAISRAGTPAASDIANKKAPRTLRVLATPTPKTETPPPVSATSAASAPPLPTSKTAATAKATKQPSRQPSIASATVPETPASERLDDNVSMTTESVSLSRASSPPPSSRIGSAPVRSKTKSQAKKERQERGKGEVEPEAPTAAEAVHEPIMGRKKKEKKPVSAAVKATAATNRTASPIKKEDKEESAAPSPVTEKPATPVVEKAVESPKPKPEPEMKPAPPEPEPEKKPTSFVQSILDSLQANGELSPAALNFFKNGPTFKHDLSASDLSDAPRIHPPLSAEEVKVLNSGKPVRRNDENAGQGKGSAANRLLVTPHSRLCIQGLSRELEDRLLELDERVRESKPPYKYSHRSANSAAAAAARLVDELLHDMTTALVPPEANAAPAQGAQAERTPSAPAKPLSYADDALAYLNQYILPVSTPRSNAAHARQYAAASAGAIDPAYADIELDPTAISSAIPRTYTTGSPTYSVSGVDVTQAPPPSSTSQSPPPLPGSQSLKPHPSGLATQYQFPTAAPHASVPSSSASGPSSSPAARNYNPDNLSDWLPLDPKSLSPTSLKNFKSLTPLYDLDALPPSLANLSSINDLLSSQPARDALAASLGAASNTLASVAAAATAAAKAAPPGAKPLGDGTWAKFGPKGEVEWSGVMDLPKELVGAGAEVFGRALREAGLAGDWNSQLGGQSVGAGTSGAGSSGARRGRNDGMNEAQRVLQEIEAALQAGRREVEGLEKRMQGLSRKNRKVAGV